MVESGEGWEAVERVGGGLRPTMGGVACGNGKTLKSNLFFDSLSLRPQTFFKKNAHRVKTFSSAPELSLASGMSFDSLVGLQNFFGFDDCFRTLTPLYGLEL